MTTQQVKFLVFFSMEYLAKKIIFAILMVATWVMDKVVLIEEYMIHRFIYKRKLGGLYFETNHRNDPPDGVLWIINDLVGNMLTPVPFWVKNRWFAKQVHLTPAMEFNIKSYALSRNIRSFRVEWKVDNDSVETRIADADERIRDWTTQNFSLNHAP